MGIIKTGRIQTMGDPIGELYVKSIWFEQIDSGTSGTLTLPAQGEVVLDQWAAGVDALASTLASGVPAFVSPATAGGVIVTATLDGDGAWTLSGTPSAYPVAIIYVYKVKFRYFDSTKQIGGYELIPSASGVFTDVTDFDGILSSADNEVQRALDTIDNHSHPDNPALDFFIASSLDTPVVTVTSDGDTVLLNIEKSGTGDIRILFSDGIFTFDCTPITNIALTAGTDASPQINYVYIPQSTKVLTKSLTGFPGTEHFSVATVICQSAASLQIYGAYKVHAWMDHVWTEGDNGHLLHINSWIRHQPTTWVSGVELTPTITEQSETEDNIDIATTAGVIAHLHKFVFPVFNTAVASSVYIVNKFGANYTRITDLNAANETSAGDAITINKYTNLVIWGVQSESPEDCKLFLNLPVGFHNTQSAALLDSEKYSNYNIPVDFVGAGFLIAKLTLKYTTGTWTLIENLDLRGQFPSIFAGGTTATPTEFYDNTFKILDETDTTKILQFQASGITTETIRTLTMADQDIDLTPDTGTFAAAIHADRHVNGSDDIQNATAAQKGLATATQITKLDGIAAGANLYVHPNHSGDVTSTGDGAQVIVSMAGKYIYRADGTDVPIADGGTGQSTAQLAINALSAVGAATNEHVLTKDTATGNAIFKEAAGGGISLAEVLTWSTL